MTVSMHCAEDDWRGRRGNMESEDMERERRRQEWEKETAENMQRERATDQRRAEQKRLIDELNKYVSECLSSGLLPSELVYSVWFLILLKSCTIYDACVQGDEIRTRARQHSEGEASAADTGQAQASARAVLGQNACKAEEERTAAAGGPGRATDTMREDSGARICSVCNSITCILTL